MNRRWVFTIALSAMAAAGLLLGSEGNLVWARGGGGGGGHGGGGHGGGGGYHGGGGGYHGGGYGGYRGGYGGYGLGYGLGGYGGYGLGYGLGGYGGYGGYGGGGYGGYSSGYNPVYGDPYGQGAYGQGYGQMPPNGPSNAGVNLTDADVLFNIRVPGNAQIWVNGGATTQTGTHREFMSSGLTPGKTYKYQIQARWTDQNGQVMDQTRSVPVQGGERRTIDFMQSQAP